MPELPGCAADGTTPFDPADHFKYVTRVPVVSSVVFDVGNEAGGATVTITHTVGVLVLGVALSASAALAPTAVEQVLAIVSGLVVAGVVSKLGLVGATSGSASRSAMSLGLSV